MKLHTLLRAYMAGIVVPTVAMLGLLLGYVITRLVLAWPVPLERVIMFPMAVVPNLWGVWNMLYLASERRWPIGIHGAALPLLLMPLGYLLLAVFGIELPAEVRRLAPLGLPLALGLYYLAWKYLVGYFNEMLGIA